MSKTFTYGEYDKREYTISNDKLLDIVIDLVYDEFFWDKELEDKEDLIKTKIKDFVECLGLAYDLEERYDEGLEEAFKPLSSEV